MRCEHLKRLSNPPPVRCRNRAVYEEENGDRFCGIHASSSARCILDDQQED